MVLTPEEWVRQHFIRFLLKEKSFPSALLQIEGGLSLNQTRKRSDILVYDNAGEKIMVIECKAPSVAITQATFDQAARYNSVYKAVCQTQTSKRPNNRKNTDFINVALNFGYVFVNKDGTNAIYQQSFANTAGLSGTRTITSTDDLTITTADHNDLNIAAAGTGEFVVNKAATQKNLPCSRLGDNLLKEEIHASLLTFFNTIQH